MQRVQTSYHRLGDQTQLESTLAHVHEEKTAERISKDALRPLLASVMDVSETNITIQTCIPTDNAARPKSILMGDCTVNDVEYVYEILCTEQENIDSDQVEYSDDGELKIPVSAFEKPEHCYGSVEIIFYEE